VVIYLTSTRQAKIEGARDAIQAVAAINARFQNSEIRVVDLGDVGPRMPMTEAAIIEGARLRVQTLLERDREARRDDRLIVGLEGGLDPVPIGGIAMYALKTWACVSDGGRWHYGAGGAVVLPERVTRQVLAGRELGEVVDEMAGEGVRGTRGAWGVLTRDLVGRRDAFRVAVISALAPFFNGAVYSRA
jgi:inosine/xanthosine triphosphatase